VHPAPLLGQHTATVLQQRLGVTATDLTDLRRHGVI
jgi:crotonobetainyl-CoA:carnitine CoA-transferase CaiB-like acyl-CoA transferase